IRDESALLAGLRRVRVGASGSASGSIIRSPSLRVVGASSTTRRARHLPARRPRGRSLLPPSAPHRLVAGPRWWLMVAGGERLVDRVRVLAIVSGGGVPDGCRVAGHRWRRQGAQAAGLGGVAGAEADAGDRLERTEVLECVRVEAGEVTGEELGVVCGLA